MGNSISNIIYNIYVKYLKKSVCLLLVLAVLVTALPVKAGAADTIGSKISIEKIDGEVSVVKASGKTAAAVAGVKLAATESLRTDKASYAYISIDDDKVIKLDELTQVNVKKSGNKLSVEVSEGSIFFEVKEKLEDNESMNLNASTMAMSIRGTSGIIGVRRVGDDIVSTAQILEGTVDITYSDINGEGSEIVLEGGQECSHTEDEEDGQPEETDLDDFPGFAAVELEGNEELCQKIKENSDLDVDWLIKNANKLLKKDQKYNAEHYSDVFEEGNTSSVASLDGDTNIPGNVNRYLKTYYEKGTGLIPVKTGMITPTPLPSQPPVNIITLTPTPTATPKPTQVASNDNSSGDQSGQGSTTVIISSPGAITGENVSQNTIAPPTLPSSSSSSGTSSSKSGSSSSSSSSSMSLMERLSKLTAFGKLLGKLYDYIQSQQDDEEEDNRPSYTVTYIGQDGETVLMTQSVKEGDTAVPPSPPTLPGYTFSSWGGMLTDVDSDRKIYALYTKNSYDVYFYDTLPVTAESPYSVQYDVFYGDYASAPTAPNHSGYTFTGWVTTATGTSTYVEDTPITGDTDFYAQYEENEKETYTITYLGYEDEVVKVLEAEEGYVVKESDAPEPPEVEGYYFWGWSTDPYGFTVEEDITIKLIYKESEDEDTYTITYLGYGDEVLKELKKEEGYEVLESDVPDPPEEVDGYYFSGWSQDPYGFKVEKDLTIQAVYKK